MRRLPIHYCAFLSRARGGGDGEMDGEREMGRGAIRSRGTDHDMAHKDHRLSKLMQDCLAECGRGPIEVWEGEKSRMRSPTLSRAVVISVEYDCPMS